MPWLVVLLLLSLNLVDDQVHDLTVRVRRLAERESAKPRAATIRTLEKVLRGAAYSLPATSPAPSEAATLLDTLEHVSEDPAGYEQLAAMVRQYGVSTGTDNPSVRARLALADLAELLRTDYDAALPALKALRGRPVVVTFWATWCAPCQDELSLIEKLHREGTSVLAVTDEPPATVNAFMQRMKYTFPAAYDPERRAFRRFGVEAMPASRVLDGKGRLRVEAGTVDEVLSTLPELR